MSDASQPPEYMSPGLSPAEWVILASIPTIPIIFYLIIVCRDILLRHRERRLRAAELKSLPVFVFSGEEPPLECAICLSDFEENEAGRTLPKCSHSFHVDCIDKWLASRSTCPLCRSTAGQVSVAEPGSAPI